jgi:hypothetical protein
LTGGNQQWAQVRELYELDVVKRTVDPSGMEGREPSTGPGLICHVVIDIESGKTVREIVSMAAVALRTLALQLEAGKLEEGFHSLESLKGEEIGEVFLDFQGTTNSLPSPLLPPSNTRISS